MHIKCRLPGGQLLRAPALQHIVAGRGEPPSPAGIPFPPSLSPSAANLPFLLEGVCAAQVALHKENPFSTRRPVCRTRITTVLGLQRTA